MWKESFKEIRNNKILLFSLSYTLFLLLLALFAPFISPYEVSEQNLALGASSPSYESVSYTHLTLPTNREV